MLKQEICACHSCQTQDKAGKPHAHYLGHMQAACAKAFFYFFYYYYLKEGNLLLTSACSKVVVDKLCHLEAEVAFKWVIPSDSSITSWHSLGAAFSTPCVGVSMPMCWLPVVVAPL